VLICGLFLFWDLFFDRLILKSDMLSHPIYEHNRKLKRFGSFFLNPNYFGAFILLVFPAAFVWTLNERKTWARVYGWVTLLALLFCLTQTQARAAVLAFGITILSLCLGPAGRMSRKRRVGFLALIVLVLTVFMPGFYEHAVKRFDSFERETAEGRSRETTWLYTQRMIVDHPLVGIGLGESQFMKFMNAYGFQDEYGVEPLDAPHNSYLQAAVYAGIPALAALLLANVLLLGRAASVFLRGADEEVTRTGFGLAVGITGFLMCMFTDLQLFTVVACVYWVFFALLLSLMTRSPGTEPREAVQVPSLTT
jgi:O-antigen ligase